MNGQFYKSNLVTLYQDDSLRKLKEFETKSIDMIFADPPYFLSSGGVSVRNGQFVSVDKGDWDKKDESFDIDVFNNQWISECYRILKDDATIWISGTHHNIYSIGHILIKNNFKILNNITWFKPNASPNLSCRYFTHSNEQIIWAKKDNKFKHKFHYKTMKSLNNDKQMRDVWQISLTPKSEKSFGYHPTQKPIQLLERIVLSSTNENDTVLDPFNGSGTTGIVTVSNSRKYIGIDLNEDFLNLTINRIKNIKFQTYLPL